MHNDEPSTLETIGTVAVILAIIVIFGFLACIA